jgi:hypothetical protein
MIATTTVPARFWKILAAGTGGILLLETVWAAVTLTVLATFTTTSYEFDGQEGMATEFGVLFAVLGGAGLLLLLLATAIAVLVAALRDRRALVGAGRALAVVCCLLHALAAVAALVQGDAYLASAVLPALLLAAVLFTRRAV